MWPSAKWKCRTDCSKLLRIPRWPCRSMGPWEHVPVKSVLVKKARKACAQCLSGSLVLSRFQKQGYVNKRIYYFGFSQCSIVTSILHTQVLSPATQLKGWEGQRQGLLFLFSTSSNDSAINNWLISMDSTWWCWVLQCEALQCPLTGNGLFLLVRRKQTPPFDNILNYLIDDWAGLCISKQN